MLEAAVTVLCAIGSWAVAGWVTVNVVKFKLEDLVRRMELLESRQDGLRTEFNEFRLQVVKEYTVLRRECPLLRKEREDGD